MTTPFRVTGTSEQMDGGVKTRVTICSIRSAADISETNKIVASPAAASAGDAATYAAAAAGKGHMESHDCISRTSSSTGPG